MPPAPCALSLIHALSLIDDPIDQVSVPDVREVDALFHDAKASAKLLAQVNNQGWLK